MNELTNARNMALDAISQLRHEIGRPCADYRRLCRHLLRADSIARKLLEAQQALESMDRLTDDIHAHFVEMQGLVA